MTLKRSFFLIYCMAFLLLPTQAFAQRSQAWQELDSTISEVLQQLSAPAFKVAANQPAILDTIEDIVSKRFDFTAFTSRAVGRSWSTFTADQQNRIIEAFTDLLRETYLNKLKGYKGETPTFINEIASSDGSRVEIQTTININGKDVPIAYRMQNKNGWKVYDVIVESLSLTQNFRGQFNTLLENGDIEGLIQAVLKKAEEARSNNLI